jgi:hypothetical protein
MKRVIVHVVCFVIIQLFMLGIVQIVKECIAQPLPQARTTRTFDDVTVTAAAVQVRPANQSRMALACKNTSATVAIRVGDSTVSATKGLQINGGETFVVTNTDAVFAASTGAAVTIACTESLR